MSASSQWETDDRPPARSLRIGVVCGGAIVQTSHIDVDAPVSVALTGLGSEGPVRIVPTSHGPLLMVSRASFGRLGRRGRFRPLADLMTVVDHRQGVLLQVGDRLRVTIPGGAVLVQGMPDGAVPQLEPGSFRPLLVQRGDAPFLGVLSSCASAAMALLVVAAGIEPVDSMAHVEVPERVMQVLISPPAPPEPDPEPVTPEPVKEDPKTVAPQPAEPEPQAVDDAVAAPRATRLRKLAKRSAVVGRLDQMAQILSSTDDESALQAALARTSGPELIASKGGEVGLRRGWGGEGRRDASMDFGGGLGGGGDRGIYRGGPADRGAVHKEVKPSERPTRRVTVPSVSTAPGASSGVVDELRRRYARQLQSCYERRLNVDPSLHGRVELSFDVKGGVVSFVAVSDNGTGDEALAECLESRAGRWRFSADSEGAFVVPLVFEQD